MSENKSEDQKSKTFYKNKLFWIAVVIVSILIIIFLPYIGSIYNSVVLQTKVNKTKINLSRLELLKLFVSLIGPFLTFIVFKNTLSIQKENRKKYEEDKEVEVKRRNTDDANREFYNLLKLFNERQKPAKKIIEKLYTNAIFNEYGYDFINDYNYTCTDVPSTKGFVRVIKTIRSDGPNFEMAQPYEPMVESKTSKDEVSVKIINEQFSSVYDTLGPYFKVLHRIVKSLNTRLEEKILEQREYETFIGILRSQISSEEFIVILVNSLFIYRGSGLGVELIGSNFFGNEKDFDINQHFELPIQKINKTDILIFENKDNNSERRADLREKLNNSKNINFLSLLKI